MKYQIDKMLFEEFQVYFLNENIIMILLAFKLLLFNTIFRMLYSSS